MLNIGKIIGKFIKNSSQRELDRLKATIEKINGWEAKIKEIPNENLKLKNKFDVILNMEVVEHVLSVDLFIKNCSALIEKNGIMFVATINKNLKSYFYAILGVEYILKWLPIGTHDWNKFLTPQELNTIATKNNFTIDETVGMKFNLFSKRWHKSTDASVNYISTFLKN